MILLCVKQIFFRSNQVHTSHIHSPFLASCEHWCSYDKIENVLPFGLSNNTLSCQCKCACPLLSTLCNEYDVLMENYWHHPNTNIFWSICSKLQGYKYKSYILSPSTQSWHTPFHFEFFHDTENHCKNIRTPNIDYDINFKSLSWFFKRNKIPSFL